MNVLNKEFGEKTVFYRKRRGISQRLLAERVGIDNTHLNRIEKGERNPPKKETVIRMADVLHLSPDEKVAFVQLAGYSPQVLEEDDLLQELSSSFDLSQAKSSLLLKRMQTDFLSGRPMPAERAHPNPPSIDEPTAKSLLEADRPAWRLKADATITHANLLAYKIWGSPVEEGKPTPPSSNLIGKNVFEVFTDSHNIDRIAMPRTNKDHWYVKLYMLILLRPIMDPAILKKVSEAIEVRPLLKILFQYAVLHPEEEPVGRNYYEYNLELIPYGDPDPYTRLTFTVKLAVLRNADGTIKDFVASYKPEGDYTVQQIKMMYEEIKESIHHYGHAYVQTMVQRELQAFVHS